MNGRIRRAARRGFTLVELMVVVAILGILASVAIPGYQGAMVRVRRSEMLSVREKMVQVMKAYHREKGRFPAYGSCANAAYSPRMNVSASSPDFPGRSRPANFESNPQWRDLVAFGVPTVTHSKLRFCWYMHSNHAHLLINHNFDQDRTYAQSNTYVYFDENPSYTYDPQPDE